MAETLSKMLALGTKAPEFTLIDTRTNQLLSLQELKSVILGAIATISMSVSAFALNPLITINGSKQFSTVQLDNGKCTGKLGKFTPPGQTLEVAGNAVRAICGALTGTCGATIIMSPDESSVRECKGKNVGHATISLDTIDITSLDSDPASGFNLSKRIDDPEKGTSHTLVIS